MRNKFLNTIFCYFSVLVSLIICIAGCGTVQHKINFQENYSLQTGTKIELGNITNKTGKAFDIDIEKMLADAFKKELKSQNLLWKLKDKIKLTLEANIIEYKKGDASKRWLMPGPAGATVLVIQCNLSDNNKVVGSAEAKRTVEVGGAYTIGAWEYIFGEVAKMVVNDLWGQIH